MSHDEADRRRRELFAELKALMQRVHRVNMELNDIERGVRPPDRIDEHWVPPFLRVNKEAVP